MSNVGSYMLPKCNFCIAGLACQAWGLTARRYHITTACQVVNVSAKGHATKSEDCLAPEVLLQRLCLLLTFHKWSRYQDDVFACFWFWKDPARLQLDLPSPTIQTYTQLPISFTLLLMSHAKSSGKSAFSSCTVWVAERSRNCLEAWPSFQGWRVYTSIHMLCSERRMTNCTWSLPHDCRPNIFCIGRRPA